jgi:hypothetical protein
LKAAAALECLEAVLLQPMQFLVCQRDVLEDPHHKGFEGCFPLGVEREPTGLEIVVLLGNTISTAPAVLRAPVPIAIAWGVQIDDVAQRQAIIHQLIVPVADRSHGQGALEQGANHLPAARLDPLGKRGFSIARQQLNSADLAHIHPERVVEAIRFGSLVGHCVGAHRGRLIRVVAGGTPTVNLSILDGIDVRSCRHGCRVREPLG